MRYTKKELKEVEDFNKSIYKIKKSSIKGAGKGLYSKIYIPKGTVLDEYRGKYYKEEEYFRKKIDPEYVWKVENGYVDAYPIKKYSNVLRYVNAPKTIQEAPMINSFVEIVRDRVYYRSSRDIEPGDEIIVDYGGGYFSKGRDQPHTYEPEEGYRCSPDRIIKAFSMLLANRDNRVHYGRQDIIIDEYSIGENPILLYWSMDDHGNIIDGGIELYYVPGTVVSIYCPNNIIYFRFLVT